jgi:phosphatidylglycerophosphate synthase
MVKVSEIRQSYTQEKARSDLIAQAWLYYCLRPISFYITPLFIRLGFSANAFTIFGLIPLLIGMYYIFNGYVNSANYIVGAVLINIWYLFDTVDGNIARFNREESFKGKLLDWMVGMVFHTLLPVCLGMSLYLGGKDEFYLFMGSKYHSEVWIIIGISKLLSELLREITSLGSKYLLGIKSVDSHGHEKINFLYVLPRAILSFEIPLLLVAALFGVIYLKAFLLYYTAYNIITFGAIVYLSLKKAVILDRKLIK